jgi:hypothetical protein
VPTQRFVRIKPPSGGFFVPARPHPDQFAQTNAGQTKKLAMTQVQVVFQVRLSVDFIAAVNGHHGHSDDLTANGHNHSELTHAVAMQSSPWTGERVPPIGRIFKLTNSFKILDYLCCF